MKSIFTATLVVLLVLSLSSLLNVILLFVQFSLNIKGSFKFLSINSETHTEILKSVS